MEDQNNSHMGQMNNEQKKILQYSSPKKNHWKKSVKKAGSMWYDWDKPTPFLNATYSQLQRQVSLSHNERFKTAKETISSLKSIFYLVNKNFEFWRSLKFPRPCKHPHSTNVNCCGPLKLLLQNGPSAWARKPH